MALAEENNQGERNTGDRSGATTTEGTRPGNSLNAAQGGTGGAATTSSASTSAAFRSRTTRSHRVFAEDPLLMSQAEVVRQQTDTIFSTNTGIQDEASTRRRHAGRATNDASEPPPTGTATSDTSSTRRDEQDLALEQQTASSSSNARQYYSAPAIMTKHESTSVLPQRQQRGVADQDLHGSYNRENDAGSLDLHGQEQTTLREQFLAGPQSSHERPRTESGDSTTSSSSCPSWQWKDRVLLGSDAEHDSPPRPQDLLAAASAFGQQRRGHEQAILHYYYLLSTREEARQMHGATNSVCSAGADQDHSSASREAAGAGHLDVSQHQKGIKADESKDGRTRDCRAEVEDELRGLEEDLEELAEMFEQLSTDASERFCAADAQPAPVRLKSRANQDHNQSEQSADAARLRSSTPPAGGSSCGTLACGITAKRLGGCACEVDFEGARQEDDMKIVPDSGETKSQKNCPKRDERRTDEEDKVKDALLRVDCAAAGVLPATASIIEDFDRLFSERVNNLKSDHRLLAITLNMEKRFTKSGLLNLLSGESEVQASLQGRLHESFSPPFPSDTRVHATAEIDAVLSAIRSCPFPSVGDSCKTTSSAAPEERRFEARGSQPKNVAGATSFVSTNPFDTDDDAMAAAGRNPVTAAAASGTTSRSRRTNPFAKSDDEGEEPVVVTSGGQQYPKKDLFSQVVSALTWVVALSNVMSTVTDETLRAIDIDDLVLLVDSLTFLLEYGDCLEEMHAYLHLRRNGVKPSKTSTGEDNHQTEKIEDQRGFSTRSLGAGASDECPGVGEEEKEVVVCLEDEEPPHNSTGRGSASGSTHAEGPPCSIKHNIQNAGISASSGSSEDPRHSATMSCQTGLLAREKAEVLPLFAQDGAAHENEYEMKKPTTSSSSSSSFSHQHPAPAAAQVPSFSRREAAGALQSANEAVAEENKAMTRDLHLHNHLHAANEISKVQIKRVLLFANERLSNSSQMVKAELAALETKEQPLDASSGSGGTGGSLSSSSVEETRSRGRKRRERMRSNLFYHDTGIAMAASEADARIFTRESRQELQDLNEGVDEEAPFRLPPAVIDVTQLGTSNYTESETNSHFFPLRANRSTAQPGRPEPEAWELPPANVWQEDDGVMNVSSMDWRPARQGVDSGFSTPGSGTYQPQNTPSSPYSPEIRQYLCWRAERPSDFGEPSPGLEVGSPSSPVSEDVGGANMLTRDRRLQMNLPRTNNSPAAHAFPTNEGDGDRDNFSRRISWDRNSDYDFLDGENDEAAVREQHDRREVDHDINVVDNAPPAPEVQVSPVVEPEEEDDDIWFEDRPLLSPSRGLRTSAAALAPRQESTRSFASVSTRASTENILDDTFREQPRVGRTTAPQTSTGRGSSRGSTAGGPAEDLFRRNSNTRGGTVASTTTTCTCIAAYRHILRSLFQAIGLLGRRGSSATSGGSRNARFAEQSRDGDDSESDVEQSPGGSGSGPTAAGGPPTPLKQQRKSSFFSLLRGGGDHAGDHEEDLFLQTSKRTTITKPLHPAFCVARNPKCKLLLHKECFDKYVQTTNRRRYVSIHKNVPPCFCAILLLECMIPPPAINQVQCPGCYQWGPYEPRQGAKFPRSDESAAGDAQRRPTKGQRSRPAPLPDSTGSGLSSWQESLRL
ncbi:unnamed protein product [Amoebophrya sp. A120]|nr:unnamed protein product [Amoebophrya sp. A120]|eukprot:GSA120T00007545001.1